MLRNVIENNKSLEDAIQSKYVDVHAYMPLWASIFVDSMVDRFNKESEKHLSRSKFVGMCILCCYEKINSFDTDEDKIKYMQTLFNKMNQK